MAEQDTPEEELSPWEMDVLKSLGENALPRWDHKAKAATFAQGHRGLLDLELDFPDAYLKRPAELCYVWKHKTGDSVRVHSYVDVEGRCVHVRWEEESETEAQSQPTHAVGPCPEQSCTACEAVAHMHSMLATRLS